MIKRLIKKVSDIQAYNIKSYIEALKKQGIILNTLCEQYINNKSSKILYILQNTLDIFYATILRLKHDINNLQYN